MQGQKKKRKSAKGKKSRRSSNEVFNFIQGKSKPDTALRASLHHKKPTALGIKNYILQNS